MKLNISAKDMLFLANFCAKNPSMIFEYKTFKTSQDRDFYVQEFSGITDNLIFIRREYDGSETYLVVYEDNCPRLPFTEKNYRKNAKENNIIIQSDDMKGGIEQ